MDLQALSASLATLPQWLIVLVMAWSLAWKGFALWRASKKNSVVWFVALLIFNTMGILEILYIFLFSKIDLRKKEEQVKTNIKKRK